MKAILFVHKVSPLEIDRMDYQQLREWSSLAEEIDKKRKEYFDALNKK
jgi:hypothetical protein